ncbi:MAG: hypothetical protein QM755_02155 [Luteolibacter sp.]
MSEEIPPQPAPSTGKIILNRIVAGVLVLLGAWLTVVDFSHPGDLLFQLSPAGMIAVLVCLLISTLLVVIAALPLRTILMADLLLVWRCALGFPLNIWLGNSVAGRTASFVFLVFSLLYLFSTLRRGGRFGVRPWVKFRHSWMAAVALFAAAVVAVPLCVLGYGRAFQNAMGDYVRLTPRGVDLVERVFEKDGRQVHLVGMMHVGDGAYYRDLTARMTAAPLDGGKKLILTEGVSDRNHLLPQDFATGKTYARLAKRFGMTSQKDEFGGPKPAAANQAEGAGGVPEASVHHDPQVTWRNADIDVADLPVGYRTTLLELLSLMSAADYPLMARPHFKMTGDQLEDFLMNGLVRSRNDVLMAHFAEADAGYTEVYMPWGAAHLPDMEKRLAGIGYRKTEEVVRPIVRFWK